MSDSNGELVKTFPQYFKSAEVGDSLRIQDFEPFSRHILVEPLPPKAKIGAIEIPEQFREKQAVGWVRRVCPDDEGGLFAVGDLVLFAAMAGLPVTLEGREMVILQYHSSEEGDILGRWPAALFAEKPPA
jgi:co-chaperonin GroES (HSP10)